LFTLIAAELHERLKNADSTKAEFEYLKAIPARDPTKTRDQPMDAKTMSDLAIKYGRLQDAVQNITRMNEKETLRDTAARKAKSQQIPEEPRVAPNGWPTIKGLQDVMKDLDNGISPEEEFGELPESLQKYGEQAARSRRGPRKRPSKSQSTSGKTEVKVIILTEC
jgi:hypothetical protein